MQHSRRIKVHDIQLYYQPKKSYPSELDGKPCTVSVEIKTGDGDKAEKITLWLKTENSLERISIIPKTGRIDDIRHYEPVTSRKPNAFKSLWKDYGLVTKFDFKNGGVKEKWISKAVVFTISRGGVEDSATTMSLKEDNIASETLNNAIAALQKIPFKKTDPNRKIVEGVLSACSQRGQEK